MNSDSLISSHRQWALSRAHALYYKYQQITPSLTYEDYESLAMLGLMQAAGRYKPGTVNFKTYASHRVEGEIIDEVRKVAPLSRNSLDHAKQIAAARKSLYHSLAPNTLTHAQVADKLGLSMDEYWIKLTKARPTLDIEIPLEPTSTSDKSNANAILLDVATEGSNPFPNAEEEVLNAELSNALRTAITNLKDLIQMQVMELRLQGLVHTEIAKILGITSARVSQIETAAIKNLKKSLL